MSLPEFEAVLKEVVNAKRLSASKMANLTELTMKNIEHDTQLVSILYRTHKTLPNPAAKVASLYVFDALSRAAKHHATKHGVTGDAFTHPGNSASFLFKVGGVVEGLFQDMVTFGSTESKEKTKKILDIWVKGNTFPSTILSQLSDILHGTQKEPDVSMPPVPMPTAFVANTVDPRSATQGTYHSPPAPPQRSLSLPTMDPQATLLALLTQAAANTANIPVPQTPSNTGIPQLEAAQLAVIQQLAHTTVSVPSVPRFLPSTDPVNIQKFPSSSGVNGSSLSPPSFRNEPRTMVKSEQRYNGYRSPESESRPDSRFDDRDSMRGRNRGSLRNRGRGDRGAGRSWDYRDRDHYRDSERDQSPLRSSRGGRSRSRSPPSRYTDRKVSRFSSPPRRRSAASQSSWRHESTHRPPIEPGKDEFGRDIRPESPNSSSAVDEHSPSPSVGPKSPTLPSEPPKEPRSPIAAKINDTSNRETNSVSSSLTANTSSPKTDTSLVKSLMDNGLGMENFNPSTFDYTSPASWEALGKMWQVTNGYLPSTEELMTFVMSGGTGQQSASSLETPKQGITPTTGFNRGRGRGRGTFGGSRGGAAYGNGRSMQEGSWNYGDHSQATDAIVLGSDANLNQHPTPNRGQTHVANVEEKTPTSGFGGRMQRIGDKWVFVRDTAMDVS